MVNVRDITVEVVPIDAVSPHPDNVRDGDIGAITASLEAHGQLLPIAVSSRENLIIGGNHTWKAAKGLGFTEMLVAFVPGMSLDDERRALLVLNRTSDVAGYDLVGLTEMLGNLQLDTGSLAGTGYDVDDLDSYLQDLDVKQSYKGDGHVPDPPVETSTKKGDAFRVGDHIVVCGDATEPEAWSSLPEPFHLLWTDPPYGVDYLGKVEYLRAAGIDSQQTRHVANDALGIPGTRQLWFESFLLAKTHALPEATFYATAPSGDLLPHLILGINDSGWQFKHALVWDKGHGVLGRADYHYQHEAVLWGMNEPVAIDHESILYGWNEKHRWNGDRKQTSVFAVPRPKQNDLHPTQKPVDLIEPMIRNSSKPGQLVVDMFAGSGGTAIAAAMSDRRSYTIELDPRYVDVIVERLSDYGTPERL